jgi:hypothetical protein
MRALIDLDRVQEAELGWKNPDDRVVCDSGEAAPQPYLSCLRVFMRRDFPGGGILRDVLHRSDAACLAGGLGQVP